MKKKGDFLPSFPICLTLLENTIERVENFNIIDMTKLIKSSLTSSGEKEKTFLRFICYLGEYN